MMASILFVAINAFARSIRASRSAFVNGATRPANEGKAPIGAGTAAPSPSAPRSLANAGRELTPAAKAAASANPDPCKNKRLETMPFLSQTLQMLEEKYNESSK
jgi:hypothetical protein